MALVQIIERTLRHDRVPIGEKPCFRTHLEANQEIVALRANSIGARHRKTEDHYATIWVATRLEADVSDA